MASGIKVTEDEFRLIKSKLRHQQPHIVAHQVDRHLAIVVKIQSSRNYDEYKAIVAAEHPPIKNSLADRVTELEHRVDALEQDRQRDRSQLAFDLHGEQHDG